MPAGQPTLSAAERLRERLKGALLFRVVLVSGFLGALALMYLRSGIDRYAVSVVLLLWAIAATYAFTLVSAVVLLRVQRLTVFSYAQLLFDVLLTTGVVFVTGGADSPFGFLYSLIVINGAILLSTPGALIVASCGSIAYASLVVLLGSGLIARPDYPVVPAPPDLQFAVRFATTNGTFFVIAFLAASLTRRVHVAEQLLEQREAERDRLASLQEALARNIGSALITTDADGRITSVNHVGEELAGARVAELVGKDLGSVFPPLRNTSSGRLQFLQSSSTEPTEFTRRTEDGGEFIVRCSAAMLRDTYQNPIGALFILQDISTLRHLQERLEQEGNEEALVEEVTGEEIPSTDGLIGNSPALTRVRQFMDKVAKSDATLLVTGESGTGKELVARAVHARGPRCNRPFVPINCGAIPAELIESELFGHAKGAFTGAVVARNGLFRAADGGTIFLDEIGDLPVPLQVKLLRVLQERSFTPVGSDSQVTVDVRVIAATNRSLEEDVFNGRFREDLFYRLNVLALPLPPLRERRQDIPLLVRRFLRQFSELHGKSVQRLSVATSRRLQEYAYPGNIRELENIIEHTVALCDGETVHEQHLPEYVLRGGRETAVVAEPRQVRYPVAEIAPAAEPADNAAGNLDDNLANYEKTIILRALAEAGGVKKRAADLLGINYRSFRHRLHKYGLSDPGSDPLPFESPSASRL